MFFSSNIESGAICEYRRFDPVYVSKMPCDSQSASSTPVNTRSPLCPWTMAVPVSWHDGSTIAADMLAFLSISKATKRSLSEASGSSRIARSWPR